MCLKSTSHAGGVSAKTVLFVCLPASLQTDGHYHCDAAKCTMTMYKVIRNGILHEWPVCCDNILVFPAELLEILERKHHARYDQICKMIIDHKSKLKSESEAQDGIHFRVEHVMRPSIGLK